MEGVLSWTYWVNLPAKNTKHKAWPGPRTQWVVEYLTFPWSATQVREAHEAYKCISSRVPIPFNNFSDPSNLLPSCQESLPVSSTQIPLRTSWSFLFFSQETKSIYHTHSCKNPSSCHIWSYGNDSYKITYIQNNGNNSQKNIITYVQNNGNDSRKFSSCTYRTMGTIATKYHHVHIEQWKW